MKKQTIIRTVIFYVALINMILTQCGINILQFVDEETYQTVSCVITAIVSVWTWWKNNSVTKEAIQADELLDELKNKKKYIDIE